MMMDNRWTIRSVSGTARRQIEELHLLTGIPYGRLVSEAIGVWYAELQKRNGWHLPSDYLFRLAESETV